MDKKIYQIQGHEIYQTELTIGQDEELLQLSEKVGDEFQKVNFKKDGFRAIIRFLIRTGLIEKVLKVVLRGDVDKINIKDITNSELEVIVTDFLAFNAGFVERLKLWSRNLAKQVKEIALQTK